MGRMKSSNDKKAQPMPISFKPKHLEMLKVLEGHYRTNRSRVVQMLVERDYKNKINKEVESEEETNESW